MLNKLILSSLLAVAATASAADLGLTKVIIALKPDKNPEAMSAERTALTTALGTALGVPVEAIIPTSAAVLNEGMANGTIDLGWLSATDVAKLPAPRPVAVLLVAQLKGRTTYDSVWLARADRPYTSIADLKDKPVAFASKTSTSGGTVPLNDLVEKGLVDPAAGPEGYFGRGNVWFGTGYVSAVERVLSGDSEAAAVSDYVFLGDKHLTPEQKSQLKVIATQGPVPTHVLAVRSALTAAQRASLAGAMGTLDAGLRDKIFGGPLVAVDEAQHLAPIAKALDTVQRMKL
jgi:phosphonate transport system substrate-binding protein